MTFEQILACESLPQPLLDEPYLESTGRVYVKDCNGEAYVISQGGEIRCVPDDEDDDDA